MLAYIQDQRHKLEAWVSFWPRHMTVCAQWSSFHDCQIRSFMQAATLAPHQPAAADPPAFVRMQLDTFVNASEVDGLTPFHLAMINGEDPIVAKSLITRFRLATPPGGTFLLKPTTLRSVSKCARVCT